MNSARAKPRPTKVVKEPVTFTLQRVHTCIDLSATCQSMLIGIGVIGAHSTQPKSDDKELVDTGAGPGSR